MKPNRYKTEITRILPVKTNNFFAVDHERKAADHDAQARGEDRWKQREELTLCIYQCRYKVVRYAWRRLGFGECEDDTADWDLYWADSYIPYEIFGKLKRY